MICNKCGKQLAENVKFCKYCGAPVEAGAPPPASRQQAGQPKKKRRGIALVIAVLCVLLLLAVGAVGLVYNDNYKAVLAAVGMGQENKPETTAGEAELTSSTSAPATEPPDETSTTQDEEEETEPETSSPEWTQPIAPAIPQPIKAAYAMASSERKSMPDSQSGKTATYGAANAIDGSNQVAWVEGVAGDGIGEWIQVHLLQQTSLTGLRIKNGYWKSERHLRLNTRVARILVSFSDGTSEEFELYDPQEKSPGVLNTSGQEILFTRPHTSDYIKVTILAVYRDGAEDNDTCITEIVPLT